MAFRNIQVALTASTGNLRSQLAYAARALDEFGKKAEGANTKAAASGRDSAKVLAGVVATVYAVKKGFDATIGAASQFETRMRNVNSISGLSEQALSALGGEVLDLSRRLPQSANVLAEGLYEIASSGFQGADGLKVLESAAKAASAGLTTTAVSGKAITAVLNAYGLGATSATDVSDTLFQTVNLGVVSFEELSGVIGDTLGSAAAAKVPIDAVGAAIATMTLAGISGAEASTSLNRVLQELIKPSDSLRLVLNQLGYESGAQALETDGLHKVMERLRVATGGQIEALLSLFPEIRAARGALALMSKEGENYNRVSAGIEDANARQGATQRALNEQMKALGAQWTLFRNRANAAAIELGTRLIPAVRDTLSAVQRLASSALPTLNHGLQALAPFFRNVVQIGGDLVDVAKALIENLSPIAQILAGIAAGAVIGALNSVATVLGTVTGFLADHPGLVQALAVAYGIKLAAAVGQAAASFATLAMDRLAVGVYDLAGGAERAAGSFRTMSGAVAGLSFGAAVAGFITVGNALANANRQAKNLVESISADVDPTVLSTVREAALKTNAELNKRLGSDNPLDEYGRKLKSVGELLTPFANKELDAARAGKKLASEQERYNKLLVQSRENVAAVGNATGLSAKGVETLAAKLKVNLTGGFNASADERQKLIDYIRDLAVESGATGTALADATTLDIAKMEELKSTVDEVAKKVEDVFSSSTDFIAAFKADAAESSQEAVASARSGLEDATSALASLQEQSGRKTRQDVSDQQSLRKARERVTEAGAKGAEEQAAATQALADLEERLAASSSAQADDAGALQKARERVATATDELREAQSKVTTQGGQIKTFYAEQIALTSKFASDLTSAAQKGLDPEVLKRLLTAGPEQAAPILQAILSDNSGALIAMVNESEQKLREINTRVVEFARLTQRAINSNTDQMARDLGAAMAIAAENMTQGAKATVANIAEAIGQPTEEVRRVAQEYGIVLAEHVKTGFRGTIPRSLSEFFANNSTTVSGPAPVERHGGGTIPGVPGTDVPMVGQAGEYVMRRAATAAIGVQTLSQMNRSGSLPNYHDGGFVSSRTMPSMPAGSSTAAIDYDRLAAAIVRAGGGSTTTIDASQHNQFHGGERLTQAQLDYAGRQQAWKLAGVVTR